MRMKIFWFFILSVLISFPTFASETVDLKMYGHITADISPQRAEFDCENTTKADWLLGKFLADLFWDAGNKHVQENLKVGTATVVVHSWDPYGYLIAGRSGLKVIVLMAKSKDDLLSAAANEPLLLGTDAHFQPQQNYPMALDFYDLRALKAYQHKMTSKHKLGLENHWPFIKQFGLGGISMDGSTSLVFENPAPDVIQWAPEDYEVNEAQKNNGMVVGNISPDGRAPLWVYNNDPSGMLQTAPSALIGSWGGIGEAASHFFSWGEDQSTWEKNGLYFLTKTMKRYANNPNLGGWHLHTGEPGDESTIHYRSTDLGDYSPGGESSFQQWLQNTGHYSLSDMGQRWYGDSSHFTDWKQVQVPDVNDFIKESVGQRIDLQGPWERKFDDNDDWTPIDLPPSEKQLFTPFGAATYRTKFTLPDGWNAPQSYFVYSFGTRSHDKIGLSVNGQDFGTLDAHNESFVSVDITSALHPGENEIILKPDADSGGWIYGPVFISSTAPESFPFSNQQLNARWVDLRLWQADSVVSIAKRTIEAARNIEPDKPLVLSAGAALQIASGMDDLATQWNLGLQNTGREAGYYPYWSRMGFVGGFYGTSEASAKPNIDKLDLMIGRILLDGDSSHDFYWDIEDYMQLENQSGWMSQHQRLLHLIGKSLPEKPSIVLLRASLPSTLGSNTSTTWDLREELNGAHFDFVYASEGQLEAGLLKDYPVIFDDGTSVMDDKLIQAINTYVQAGGTFIAESDTGRNSLTQANAWPIFPLTGMQVANADEKGPVHFQTSLPIFQGWDNRTFGGNKGIGMTANSSGVVPLALWNDGNIAIGICPIGNGRIIVLGASFWHHPDSWNKQNDAWATDKEFFEKLFGDLNVLRNTQSTDSRIWTRETITKNGLQEWLIAFNNNKDATTGDVSFHVNQNPVQVWDLISGSPVQYDYSSDGFITIHDLSFDSYETKAFATMRGTFADALPVWWGEKTKYWMNRATATPETGTPDQNASKETIPFEQWKFSPDPDKTIFSAGNWLQPDFDDSQWSMINSGAWVVTRQGNTDNLQVGLYRSSFTVPPEWSGGHVLLNLYSFDTPIASDQAQFFVNGKPITTYSAHGWSQTLNYNVTDAIKPGNNILAVEVEGQSPLTGLTGTVWISYEKNLSSSQSLDGGWQIDGSTDSTGSIPGTIEGNYLNRSFNVPATWQGSQVFLRIQTPSQWLGLVVMNGHPIAYNGFLHPFGLIADINLTPYLNFGADNTIELWPYKTIPAKNNQEPSKVNMEISDILVGIK